MSSSDLALKLSAVCTASYGFQGLVLPDTAHKLYMKTTPTPQSKSIWRWFGHSLLSSAALQGMVAATGKQGPNRKAVLKGYALQWATAPVLMGVQAKSGDFKPEMAVANGALCLALGAYMWKKADGIN
mmetsp:Transcript_22408/g.27016  ORF Transcript_22408/g.27016 Transcript_22408/m.27016 type:complete len:128 (+) Transcript_22408:92-475(+)|eukprot:CAMPEP_0197855580 /NCGR_PEP_ID=MMETSP1438-20131217/26916_1 /TAXON_ID=1461541 /ORGANISM="Pterosperma sp., Strain CCMP1384" /LENGTH=127 /DNA_ID=CAMNT_0043470753 /DNA_START=92 /DNA_END=475 /DNA_ORIENTATION=+